MASTIGTIQGPADLLAASVIIMLAAWPLSIAIFILNITVAIAIVWRVQRNQMKLVGPASVLPKSAFIPNLTKAAFVLTTMSFSWPLTAIPGLLCAYISKKKLPQAPGKGLLTASFFIGYLVVVQFILAMIFIFVMA